MNESECSFCEKKRSEVKKIISGSKAYICDNCVGLFNDIITEDNIIAEDKGDDTLTPDNTPRIIRSAEIDKKPLNTFIDEALGVDDPFGEDKRTVGDFLDAYTKACAKTKDTSPKPIHHLPPTVELIGFTRLFAILADAGVPIMSCLGSLEKDMQLEPLSAVAGVMKDRVSKGSTLSEAVMSFSEHFDDLFCAMVRAGELGSSLDATLTELSSFLETEKAVLEKMGTAPIQTVALCLFAKTFAMLLNRGVPLIESFDITASVMPTDDHRTALRTARKMVALEGVSFADALHQTDMFPRTLVAIVSAGETSGKLADALNKLAGHYQTELGL